MHLNGNNPIKIEIMKKNIFLLLVAVGITLVSCSEDQDDNADGIVEEIEIDQ